MVMIFTHLLLGEKNNLSKVWLAAHWEKKLKRYHIFQIDIEKSVKDIITNEVILDLRLSGHLLFGIVKIFSRKTNYLLNECSEIFHKVKIYRSTLIDLPDNKLQAPLHKITLPELFDNFESNNLEVDDILSTHQSRIEDITLKESFGNLCLEAGDDFELFREDDPVNFDEDIDVVSLLSIDLQGNDQKANTGLKILIKGNGVDANFMNGINRDSDGCIDFAENMSFSSNDFENHNGINDSHAIHRVSTNKDLLSTGNQDKRLTKKSYLALRVSISTEIISSFTAFREQKLKNKTQLNLDPLPGDKLYLRHCTKRKRKLVIDEAKTLSDDTLKRQYQERWGLLDLAPPTKRSMVLKETGGCEQLLRLPGQRILHDDIHWLFRRNMRINKEPDNSHDSSNEEEEEYPEEVEMLRGNVPEETEQMCPAPCKLNINLEGEYVSDTNEPMCTNGDQEFGCPVTDSSNESNHLQIDNFSVEPVRNSSALQSQNSKMDSQCLSERGTVSFLKMLKSSFAVDEVVKFSDLTSGDRRLQVAEKFSSGLMLKKFRVIELQQQESYGEIYFSPGQNFLSACAELC